MQDHPRPTAIQIHIVSVYPDGMKEELLCTNKNNIPRCIRDALDHPGYITLFPEDVPLGDFGTGLKCDTIEDHNTLSIAVPQFISLCKTATPIQESPPGALPYVQLEYTTPENL